MLAIIFDKEKNRINYYRDDKYLNINGLDLAAERLANKDLEEGYDVMKDFK